MTDTQILVAAISFAGASLCFDGVDRKLLEHDGQFVEIRAAGERMAKQIYAVSKKLDDHLRWHAS